MRVGHLEIPAARPLESLAFYRDVLGFALEANQGDRFLWLRAGEATLLLRPGPPRAPGTAAETPNLVLYVEDLPAFVTSLRARGARLEQHGTCFYLQDPDGHWLQVVDPDEDHSDPASSAP